VEPLSDEISSESTPTSAAEPCPTCGRSPSVCVCDRTEPLATKRRVLILQHPQEKDVELGSGPLLAAGLPRARLVVGLSWASLAQALDKEHADPARWGVLYPKSLPKGAPALPAKPGVLVIDRHGKRARAAALAGIVVLDGSWAQAKALWWRNAWLLKLQRVLVQPKEASIYGTMRREPSREAVSTLEAAAAALTACGEDPEVEARLRRLFRTLVQRARDVRQAARPARRPRRT
jgi:hypothetical protein